MNEERQAKRKKWNEILRDWNESGVSAAAYCRTNDIPSWQFNYWKKRLLSKSEEDGERRFVEFPFVNERPRNSGLWFELPSGLRLVIESGFKVDELLRVLKVVGDDGC